MTKTSCLCIQDSDLKLCHMIGSEKLVTQIRSACVSEIENPANFQAFPFTQHSSGDSYKSLANSMCVVLMFDSQSQSEPNSDPPAMNPWMVDG